MTADREDRCPQCGRPGRLGEPCPANSGYHFIPAAPRPDLDLGRRFGDFLALEVLGEGGMGKVFYAWDLRLQRRVALKVLTRDVGLLEAEARALLNLEDPHIVRAYDFGQTEGRAFLAMEYIEGGSLSQLRNQLTRADLREILRQIGRGLAAAHAIGLIHRDLKPPNLMLRRLQDGAWFAVLVDFGIAKDITEGSDTSQVLGTITYMAPEQLHGRSLGPWTDLYALALITAELLSGEKLYQGKNKWEVIDLKRSPEHDPLACVASQLPTAFLAPLRRALSLQPSARPTLAIFLAELDRAFAAAEGPIALPHEVSAVTEPATENTPERVSSYPPSPPGSRLLGLLLSVGIALLVALGVLLFQASNQDPGDAALPLDRSLDSQHPQVLELVVEKPPTADENPGDFAPLRPPQDAGPPSASPPLPDAGPRDAAPHDAAPPSPAENCARLLKARLCEKYRACLKALPEGAEGQRLREEWGLGSCRPLKTRPPAQPPSAPKTEAPPTRPPPEPLPPPGFR